ncbi:MAG: hypothetical protein JRN06_07600 [Nitrososphaerota archaeon]|nr:hypothetical protein [Nitrososphaerota archaeon]MDG7024353.1 hypothetical protein [Nitrososphaerota archaeon]
MDAPGEFRRGPVQGIAGSDGSVSIASQTVEFWTGPDWDFFGGALRTSGVRSFQNRDALSVTKSKVAGPWRVPALSPVLKTVRYLRFKRPAEAQHIWHGKQVPSEIRGLITQNSKGVSIPELSEMVLDRFGFVSSFEAVQRWAERD